MARRRRRLVRRVIQLYVGLALFGASSAMLVQANLGLDPWDVFHQGISDQSGLRIGTVTVIVGVAVLLLWIPLRQRPGFGTLSNAVVVGVAVNVTLDLLPAPDALVPRWGLLLGGIVLNGLATGCYIGARLGPGPRDGLMTGLAARGKSIRLVRTGIELAVLALGFVLGGTVGLGTVLYAVAIGPLAHVFIPRCTVRLDEDRTPEPAPVRLPEPELGPSVAACSPISSP